MRNIEPNGSSKLKISYFSKLFTKKEIFPSFVAASFVAFDIFHTFDKQTIKLLFDLIIYLDFCLFLNFKRGWGRFFASENFGKRKVHIFYIYLEYSILYFYFIPYLYMFRNVQHLFKGKKDIY